MLDVVGGRRRRLFTSSAHKQFKNSGLSNYNAIKYGGETSCM
jgi:hypothetical protein